MHDPFGTTFHPINRLYRKRYVHEELLTRYPALPRSSRSGRRGPTTANPVDYPLTAHVVASHAGPGLTSQEVEAVIDGRQVVLLGNSAGVLALGDYKARLLKGSYAPTKPNGYDLYITYEFLFPDGHTRPYELIGLGADVLPPTQP